jgi:hypothetical protein
MAVLTARLCQRTSLAAEWTAVNPVLGRGEVGYEADTGRKKTGDEATPWNELDYDHERVWQPLTPQELPTAHQAAAGLSQRATILYLFQNLGAGSGDYGYAWLTEDEQLIVTEDA